MKAIMVMFDTLNRRMLPPYGCDWIHAPNFQRLADKSVTFNNAYVGSMPCMPARRELHTGRYNFLHRSWGPLEPFDDSMPRILKNNDIYTHLVTDHMHYFEDGGVNYHTRYVTWEYLRGQQGDPWIGDLNDPGAPEQLIDIPEQAPQWFKTIRRQDWVNRKYMPREEQQPQPKTFERGLEFMRTNAEQDNWFLHIETFDPHEPFFSPEKYKELYPDDYDGPHLDWPAYRQVTELPEVVQHVRNKYTALLSMCDAYLGKVLDLMDELNLWEDTMLIVNTDHGFLLGEHDWWAKMVQPFYNEVAHVPFFVYDPRSPQRQGITCDSLVQNIDVPATLLDFFDVEQPPDMQGIPLRDAVATGADVHEGLIFGIHGGHVNVTDGRYIYMRAPSAENSPLYEYTLMPSHMRFPFGHNELGAIELAAPFSFMKGCQVMKIPARNPRSGIYHDFGTLLFDQQSDYEQEVPLDAPEVERKMIELMVDLMRKNDAPTEQFERLELI